MRVYPIREELQTEKSRIVREVKKNIN
jgi:hypothetical protein